MRAAPPTRSEREQLIRAEQCALKPFRWGKQTTTTAGSEAVNKGAGAGRAA